MTDIQRLLPKPTRLTILCLSSCPTEGAFGEHQCHCLARGPALHLLQHPALCPASAENPGGPPHLMPWSPYLCYIPTTKPSIPQAPPRPGVPLIFLIHHSLRQYFRCCWACKFLGGFGKILALLHWTAER